MKKNILNIAGATVISKENQSQINGGASGCNIDKCGCDCTGSVTGPACCSLILGCLQVYTCNDAS